MFIAQCTDHEGHTYYFGPFVLEDHANKFLDEKEKDPYFSCGRFEVHYLNSSKTPSGFALTNA